MENSMTLHKNQEKISAGCLRFKLNLLLYCIISAVNGKRLHFSQKDILLCAHWLWAGSTGNKIQPFWWMHYTPDFIRTQWGFIRRNTCWPGASFEERRYVGTTATDSPKVCQVWICECWAFGKIRQGALSKMCEAQKRHMVLLYFH